MSTPIKSVRWKSLVATSAITAAVYLPIIAVESDTGAVLYWLLLFILVTGAALAVITMTLTGGWRKALTLSGIMFVSLLVSAILFRQSYPIRTTCRWFFHADTYKTRLLEQHGYIPNQISYMEWDGWGFAGEGTTVFLVHDPGDHLRNATRGRYGLVAKELSCEVWQLRRLEKDWYSVVFFTNEVPGACTRP